MEWCRRSARSGEQRRALPHPSSVLPALDPTEPSLKTETKRIWTRVKKDEKRAQLGEIQRTSIAMPLEIHTRVRVAAVQRRESFNDWIMEAVQQRLEREAS